MNSVCVATYNGEKYIEEQLRSILTQIAADDEVIVSDDGSTDGTCAIVESLTDPRIKLLHHNGHNFKQNFIYALQHTQGEYIFLSDQDDVWMPEKYRICCEQLQNFDLVITDSVVTDENLQTIQSSFFNFYKSGPGLIKNSVRNTYFGACMAFRRRILNAAMPFPTTNEIGHDIWIGLVAEIIGKVQFLHQPLLLYRRHASALTKLDGSLMTRSKRPLCVKIWSRMIVLLDVMRFFIRYKFGKIGKKI